MPRANAVVTTMPTNIKSPLQAVRDGKITRKTTAIQACSPHLAGHSMNKGSAELIPNISKELMVFTVSGAHRQIVRRRDGGCAVSADS